LFGAHDERDTRVVAAEQQGLINDGRAVGSGAARLVAIEDREARAEVPFGQRDL
jgi:hypothetical protein